LASLFSRLRGKPLEQLEREGVRKRERSRRVRGVRGRVGDALVCRGMKAEINRDEGNPSMKMQLRAETRDETVLDNPKCDLEPGLVPTVAPTVPPRHPGATGKYVPISYFRRLVGDLMHFCAKVPSATIERHMELPGLVAARRACVPPPSWSAIFMRAYAVVASRTPALRTSYLTFPWPRLYEHAINIATLNVDRQLANERVVIYAHAPSPECLTLRELDTVINVHRYDPVDSIPSYRSAARLSRVPWPFRRLVWWAALNVFGSVRCAHFGTFGVSSVGALGAGITRLTPLLTSQLHYGMFDAAGGVDMRLSFDHRVLDGATAAVALADMEDVLRGEITRGCTETARNGTIP
jgi:hypothetical protein